MKRELLNDLYSLPNHCPFNLSNHLYTYNLNNSLSPPNHHLWIPLSTSESTKSSFLHTFHIYTTLTTLIVHQNTVLKYPSVYQIIVFTYLRQPLSLQTVFTYIIFINLLSLHNHRFYTHTTIFGWWILTYKISCYNYNLQKPVSCIFFSLQYHLFISLFFNQWFKAQHPIIIMCVCLLPYHHKLLYLQ